MVLAEFILHSMGVAKRTAGLEELHSTGIFSINDDKCYRDKQSGLRDIEKN